MDFLVNFILSIVGSIIAAIIIFFTATWASKNARWVLTASASALLNIDVKYVFKNSKEAEKTIQEALLKATTVKIFTSRGNQFQRDSYSVILHNLEQKKHFIQVLLPNPEKSPRTIDWIDQREKEIVTVSQAYKSGILKKQIKSSIEYLRSYMETGRFEIRLYDYPHLARIIITENYLFLQPYKEAIEGRDCPVYQYSRGDMYDMFNRFFNTIWLDSEDIPTA